MNGPWPVDLEAVRAAARRLAGRIRRTPIASSPELDARAGRSIHLKCENLQVGGAFKIRGATNAVLLLDEAEAARGVVTHSSGNHAQALALAARARGIRAHVVMPVDAPSIKREAARAAGAIVVDCPPGLRAREATTRTVIEQIGAVLVPPYDDARVIAGQGTLALELLEEVPDLDTVVAPVGGGGLVSGLACALAEAAPHVEVVAAEPAGADDAFRSKEAGRRLEQTSPETLADGLRTSLGHLTWPVVRDLVSEVVRVQEEEIVEAMIWLFEREALVVEPSGAVALAAALQTGFGRRGGRQRVVVILSGGNIDPSRRTAILNGRSDPAG